MAPSAVTPGLCPEGCCMDASPLQYRPGSELALAAHKARVGEAAGEWGAGLAAPAALLQPPVATWSRGFEICSAAFRGAQIQWLMNRVPTGDTYYPGVIINKAPFHLDPYITWPPSDGPGPAMLKGSEDERDHLPDTGCDLGRGAGMKRPASQVSSSFGSSPQLRPGWDPATPHPERSPRPRLLSQTLCPVPGGSVLSSGRLSLRREGSGTHSIA